MNTVFSEKLKERSLGFLKSIVDVALFSLAFGVGVAFSGSKNPRGVYEAAAWAQGVSFDSMVRAFRRLREKGYIKHDLTVTGEGQRRLHAMFPQPRTYPKKWNGTWYLVSFDVPERLDWKRNAFRETLKELGFGKLHASLWISPYHFLGDVQTYLKGQRMLNYVILASSKEVGTERSKELARRVFQLHKLNDEYIQFLAEVGEINNNVQQQFQCIFHYFSLLHQDPFLPKPLLPVPWHGEKAHSIFRKILLPHWKGWKGE